MKDATFYFLSEIYRILSGNISGNVYSIEQTPEATDTLFVRVSSAFSQKTNNKDKFRAVYVANIDIVSKVSRQALSYASLNTLSNQVTTLLNPTVSHKALIENADFYPVYGRFIDSTDFTDTSDNEYILRRVLTFESLITQK